MAKSRFKTGLGVCHGWLVRQVPIPARTLLDKPAAAPDTDVDMVLKPLPTSHGRLAHAPSSEWCALLAAAPLGSLSTRHFEFEFHVDRSAALRNCAARFGASASRLDCG